MIRGMGFNRIAVLENGIKQEGQQWGADHGLELDAFNIGTVNVLKGPSSLLYGSDAMGGVIDVVPPTCLWIIGCLEMSHCWVNQSMEPSEDH